MKTDLSILHTEFPLLSRTIHGGKPLVYLDNAATTQKPQVVIDAVNRFYREKNSNVHRGAHALASEATEAYEAARRAVAKFLHADRADEVVFTKGTTESINLVASAWGGKHLSQGDEILLTGMEHHANIVPWQMIAERTGARIVVVPVEDDGSIDVKAAANLITDRTVLFSFTHVSNTLGTVNPVRELCALARSHGALTLVDGAQAVAHEQVNVADIGCDFYVFSAHKLFGPTGIGVLWGRYDILNSMPPYQGGGAMIRSVSFEGTTFNDVPYRFEAGTPHIAGAVGLHAALNWFSELDSELVRKHENALLKHMVDGLTSIHGVRFIGQASNRVGIVSFVVEGVHAHDLGVLLDEQGVAIRTGHHCTMPLMERFGCSTVARASLAVYNTHDDVDAFLLAVTRSVEMLV